MEQVLGSILLDSDEEDTEDSDDPHEPVLEGRDDDFEDLYDDMNEELDGVHKPFPWYIMLVPESTALSMSVSPASPLVSPPISNPVSPSHHQVSCFGNIADRDNSAMTSFHIRRSTIATPKSPLEVFHSSLQMIYCV